MCPNLPSQKPDHLPVWPVFTLRQRNDHQKKKRSSFTFRSVLIPMFRTVKPTRFAVVFVVFVDVILQATTPAKKRIRKRSHKLEHDDTAVAEEDIRRDNAKEKRDIKRAISNSKQTTTKVLWLRVCVLFSCFTRTTIVSHYVHLVLIRLCDAKSAFRTVLSHFVSFLYH
jgi:hypothetical protein